MARVSDSTPAYQGPGDPVKLAIEAFRNGQDPEQALYGSQEEPAPEPQPQEEASEPVGGLPPSMEREEKGLTKPDIANSDIEELFVKGAGGEKYKLAIDYKDREKVKQAYLKAAGMTKFQKERDLSRKELEELRKKHEELSGHFGELDRLYKEGGVKALYERLAGEGAWSKAVEEELSARERLELMSPAERHQHDLQERDRRASAEKSKVEQQYKELLSKVESEREQAALKSVESKLVPAFEKYRFAGRLGDEDAEHTIDSAIWTQVTSRLAELPDDQDLTASVIDKTFKEVASHYRRVMDKQASSQAKKQVERQKEQAGVRAQVAVKKGIAAQTLDQEISQAVEKSDWSSLLQKVIKGR